MVDGRNRSTSAALLLVGAAGLLMVLQTQQRVENTAIPRPTNEVQSQFATLFDNIKPLYQSQSQGLVGLETVLDLDMMEKKAEGSEVVLDLDATTADDHKADSKSSRPIKAETEQEEVEKAPVSGHLMIGVAGVISSSWPCLSDHHSSLWQAWETKPRVTVLVWNQINGYVDWLRQEFLNDARTKCSTECHFTADRGLLNEADGVLFHGPNHYAHDFPPSKPEGQKWVFMTLEQPHYFKDPGLLSESRRRLTLPPRPRLAWICMSHDPHVHLLRPTNKMTLPE
jgi:hypothetical protein